MSFADRLEQRAQARKAREDVEISERVAPIARRGLENLAGFRALGEEMGIPEELLKELDDAVVGLQDIATWDEDE